MLFGGGGYTVTIIVTFIHTHFFSGLIFLFFCINTFYLEPNSDQKPLGLEQYVTHSNKVRNKIRIQKENEKKNERKNEWANK